MLSFFKKGKNAETKGTESSVDSAALFGEEADGAAPNQEVKTNLYFHPKSRIGQEEKYYFQFLHGELPPLKPNQVSLSGIDIKLIDDGRWIVTAFVRNSLAKPIRFDDTPLLLLDTEGKVLVRKAFPLQEIGEVPKETSIPWVFSFEKDEVDGKTLPSSGWKLAFELKQKHSLDLEETWEKSLATEQKEQLEAMIQKNPPPKPGEINFMGIQAKRVEGGKLYVTLLIRNGSQKTINLEQLPLVVEDASGDVVAKGGFKLGSLEVKANTSKPWTFIFPENLILKEELDLTKWKAYPPKHR